jgi:hypothetical protein
MRNDDLRKRSNSDMMNMNDDLLIKLKGKFLIIEP